MWAGLLRPVRLALARPDADHVREGLRAGAIDGRTRRSEGCALQRRGAHDARPARTLGRRLRRLGVVDATPDRAEQPAREEAAEEAGEQPERLVEQAHLSQPTRLAAHAVRLARET